jgi:dTDP-4-dehydrorhamnose 3,5-epimerase
MKFTKTDISDVVIIEPDVFEDDRGWFMEIFNERKFHAGLEDLGQNNLKPFVQDNHSCSHKGVLRGLHFQKAPSEQGKLVYVTEGAVFDVAVDIRPKSSTFGKWLGVELSAENNKQVWIPEGFAHGFLVLEDNTHFHYKTTNFYQPRDEKAIIWNDDELAIDWPKINQLKIGKKDKKAKSFEEISKSL